MPNLDSCGEPLYVTYLSSVIAHIYAYVLINVTSYQTIL